MEIPLQLMSPPTPAVLTTRHSTQTFTGPDYFCPCAEEAAASPLLSPLSDYNRYIPYRPQVAPSQQASRPYPPIPYQSTQYAPKPPTHRSRPSETSVKSINISEWHHLDNRQLIRTFTSLGKEVERFSQPFATEDEYNHDQLQSGITKLGLYQNLFRRRCEPLALVQALAKPEGRQKFVEGIIWAALTGWVFKTAVESGLRRDSVSSYQPSNRFMLDQYLSNQISAVQEPIQQLWGLISLFPQAPELRGGASTELDLRSVFILARDKAVLIHSQPAPFLVSSSSPDHDSSRPSSAGSGEFREAHGETYGSYDGASSPAFHSPNLGSSDPSSSTQTPTPSSSSLTRPTLRQKDSGFFSYSEYDYCGAEWIVSPGLYKSTNDGFVSIVHPIRWPPVELDETAEVWEPVVTHSWPPRMSVEQPRQEAVDRDRGFWGGLLAWIWGVLVTVGGWFKCGARGRKGYGELRQQRERGIREAVANSGTVAYWHVLQDVKVDIIDGASRGKQVDMGW